MGDITVINRDIELYKRFKDGSNKPRLSKLFKMFDIQPNPFQQEVIKAFDDNYKEWSTIIFACARRSGKSIAASFLAILELLIPNSNVSLVSPSNRQLNIIFDEVVKGIKKLNLPVAKLDTNSKIIKLENNSTFRAGSEQTVSTLEGFDISLLIIDEVFLIPSITKILTSLSPALSSYGVYDDTKMAIAKTVMLGSVKSNKEALSYLNKGMRKESGYIALKYTAKDNPLLTEDYLEAEREKLGEEAYLQEYMCIPMASEVTTVFTEFSYSDNVRDLSYIKSLIDKDSTLVFGLDIGATDFTSFIICYVEAGKYYIIDGFEINNSSEKIIAEHIRELLSVYNITLSDFSFIDPSAKLTRIGLAQDHDLLFFPAKNDIRKGINTINDLFRSKKLFIHKDMTNLISQIQDIEWKDNRSSSDPFKRHKKHHFDFIASLRYCIYSHFHINNSGGIEVI